MASGWDPAQPSLGPILPQAIPRDEWEAVLRLGRSVRFAKGQTIIEQGTKASTLYLIRDGRVEISLSSAEGHKVVLNHMGPGEILGEIAVLDGSPRSANGIAASETVDLTAIEKAHVLRLLETTPPVAMAVIRELCGRVRNASEMFEVKSEKSGRLRLARALLRLAAKWGEGGDGAPGTRRLHGFSQSDLGDFAGLARENVNRYLKGWEEEGLIERSETGLTLLDIDTISDQAGY